MWACEVSGGNIFVYAFDFLDKFNIMSKLKENGDELYVNHKPIFTFHLQIINTNKRSNNRAYHSAPEYACESKNCLLNGLKSNFQVVDILEEFKKVR